MARLFLLLGFGLLTSLVGRVHPTPGAEQLLMQEATFIFEGELIRTVPYFLPDGIRLFHAILVRVTRVLKGVLPFETVEVVYPGVRVMATFRTPAGKNCGFWPCQFWSRRLVGTRIDRARE
ncbi:hypothetical protein [Hymenobacter rubripertinctus]|nr:hypothetical protein [Hymenobacter rubripertinctus]